MSTQDENEEKRTAAEDEQADAEQEPEDAKAVDDEKETVEDDSKQKLDDLQDQLDSVQDNYLRAEAEIQNIQNRNKKERADLLKYGGQHLANDIVPVVDDLERALQVEVSDENGKQLKSGIEMVQKKLNKALKDNDITAIDESNVEFDPTLHQAVQNIPADDDHPSGTVAQILQKGYKLNDRVLRPAMVVVAQ